MGYSNIDFLAWGFWRKNYSADIMCEEYLLNFSCFGILKKYFLEKTSFTWFIINVFTTIILFALITLGLLFEWSIRKIFTIFSEKKTRSLKQETITASTEHRAFKHS